MCLEVMNVRMQTLISTLEFHHSFVFMANTWGPGKNKLLQLVYWVKEIKLTDGKSKTRQKKTLPGCLSWCHSSNDEFIIPISAFMTSHWPIIVGHCEKPQWFLTCAKFIKSWCWMDYYQGILPMKVHLLSGSAWKNKQTIASLGESSNILSIWDLSG